jgi:hypothetical protein
VGASVVAVSPTVVDVVVVEAVVGVVGAAVATGALAGDWLVQPTLATAQNNSEPSERARLTERVRYEAL